jgi:hypothetical protein
VKPANNRKRTGQFPKGVSGNPKGRTPGTHNRSTLGIKALIQSIVDFETFDRHYFDYAMTGKPNAVKVEIWKVLHYYGYGKPTERIEIDADIEAKYDLLSQATGIVMESMV